MRNSGKQRIKFNLFRQMFHSVEQRLKPCRKDSKSAIENQTEEIKKRQEQMINLAKSYTMTLYIWISCVLPILLALLVVFLHTFIGLQFICKDEQGNFAILLYEWIRSTFFGMC